jgi:ribosomal protein L32
MTFLLIWLALAATLGILAKQRGRSVFAWFLIGAVLSPLLGFVLLMMSQDLALSEAIDTITHDMEMTHVKCPKCTEYVMPEATVCPYCRNALQPNPEYVKQRMADKLAEEAELQRGRQFNFIIATGVAVAIAVVAWLSTFL